MILQRLELSVLPGYEVEFEAAFTQVRDVPFMARGFRRLHVARGVERPSVYLVDVLWETVEDLVAFGEGPLAGRWADALRPFLTQAPSAEPFVLRDGLSVVSGGHL